MQSSLHPSCCHSSGALITALRGDRYVVNCVDSHPSLPLMACCGIDATVKLWSPCLTHPRALSPQLLTCLAYNEVERSAVGTASMLRGFHAMCKAFTKQHLEGVVQREEEEQQWQQQQRQRR